MYECVLGFDIDDCDLDITDESRKLLFNDGVLYMLFVVVISVIVCAGR